MPRSIHLALWNALPPSPRSIPRLLRTVRHLSSRQIIGQFRLRLWLLGGDDLTKWANKQTPSPISPAWSPVTHFLCPPQAQLKSDSILSGELTLLNRTEQIGTPPRWDNTEPPKLWQYNIHYMDYLWAMPTELARSLVIDYIDNHQPRSGHCGWEPYPLSLRLMNWCALLYGRDREQTLADEAGHEKISVCIQLMATWLSKNLETHILANHLLENFIALSFAASCLGLTEENWTATAQRGLQAELKEQILPDGGHYERSPMYQCRILCGLLWLINTGEPSLRSLVEPYVPRMANNLQAMTHPDGQIALFNDAAHGVYNTPGELLGFAEELGLEIDRQASGQTAWLSDSGYAVGGLEGGDGHCFIMDAGELAPAYQPGHAHSDLLSFELSLFGKRLIVDAGNYDYVASNMRQYCRGVKAHNTIEINGQDQCELWSAFRIGRRASPQRVDVKVNSDSGELGIKASHNGYDHLPGRPRHTRSAKWYPQGVLLVEDQVESTEEVEVVSRLRLGEGWSLRAVNIDHYELAFGDRVATVKLLSEDGWQIEDGWTCPGFYDKRPCRVLTCRSRGRSSRSGYAIVAGRFDRISPFEYVEIGGQVFDW